MALQHAKLGARVRVGVILLEMVEAEQGALAADAAVATQDIKVWDELRFRAVLRATKRFALSTQSGKKRANSAPATYGAAFPERDLGVLPRLEEACFENRQAFLGQGVRPYRGAVGAGQETVQRSRSLAEVDQTDCVDVAQDLTGHTP